MYVVSLIKIYMPAIRIIVSLALWFPVSALVVYLASYVLQLFTFNWIIVWVLAIITGWIFELIFKDTYPQDH